MVKKGVAAPEDQNVTFVELFFDIVYVFCVTQIVHLLEKDLNFTTIIESILIFWLIWWSWTQFTWALNVGDTTHHLIQLGTLIATGIAFIMAIAIPEAFGNFSLLFSIAYILTRILGLIIYVIGGWGNSSQIAVVKLFSLMSIPGFISVLIGGFLGGEIQYIFWAAAIIFDLNSATRGAGREGWELNMDHFSERHGLFVIIALGETLIVAASGATEKSFENNQIVILVLVVSITCILWWSYFAERKPHLDKSFELVENGPEQTKMARDVYSISHFPMLYGIILYALAVEKAITHPTDPITVEGSIILGLGILLFVGGMIIATWRASREILWLRGIFSGIISVLVFVFSDFEQIYSLSIVFVGLLLLVFFEDYFIHRNQDISMKHSLD